jgi:hypothetical protein
VQKDRACQDEGADEEEDQRIGEWREHIFRRSNLKQDADGGAEESGDSERQRLCHPQNDNGREHCGQAVCRGREPGQRERQQNEEDSGREDATDFPAH